MMKPMLLLAASAVAGVLAAPVPTMPTQYTVSGTISLPYANIQEPFTTSVDLVNNRQMVSYYNDLDVYITRGDLNAMYQVNPVLGERVCFETDGPVNATSFFPDLSTFSYTGSQTVNNVACYAYTYSFTQGAKVNTYSFFVDASSGAPVQYSWLGYDVLLGSHYDQYIIDYTNFQAGPASFANTTFDKPSIGCGAFGGDSFENPSVLLSHMFPGTVPGSETYNHYRNKHGKRYEPAEEADRELYFHKNLRFIHMANRKYRQEGRSLVLAPNMLVDSTPVEMRLRAGVSDRRRPANNGAHAVHEAPVSLRDLPASVNWTAAGAVTAVKDQGICGSCWSFGTAEVIEGQLWKKTGDLVHLSQQELMDCSWNFGNYACDGGEDFLAYQWIMQNGGIAAAADYGPYLMADGMCHANSTQSKVNLSGYVNVTVGSEPALMDALANIGPISVAIDASQPSFSFYSDGVYYDANCGNTPDALDHAVLAVGYGTLNGEDYWIVKNSWSTHYGDNGYVLMSRKDNNCGVATAATYPLL